MLTLPIKKKWFDMIASGEKKEEYREIKPYWTKRLFKTDIQFDIEAIINKIRNGECNFSKTVILKNGYSKMAPEMKCICKIKLGQGKLEWGAEEGKEYYILEILEIVGGEDE